MSLYDVSVSLSIPSLVNTNIMYFDRTRWQFREYHQNRLVPVVSLFLFVASSRTNRFNYGNFVCRA
jgi:hypothetical protein